MGAPQAGPSLAALEDADRVPSGPQQPKKGKIMIRLATLAIALAASTPAWSAFNNLFIAPVPTLDEIGLGALIALVAGIAGWAVRRRNRR